MATEVKLPRLGQGMESGVIVRWLKSPGDQVRKGDPLYELDTDKVTQEVEAESDGLLTEILVGEGEVAVGTTVALIDGADGEGQAEPTGDTKADASRGADRASADRACTRRRDRAEHSTGAGSRGSDLDGQGQGLAARPPDRARARRRPGLRRADRARRAHPRAGRRADGAGRRPAASPVALPAVPGTATVEVVPLTTIRKTIARRLTEAWTAPVFQLGVGADMTQVLALREALVAGLEEGAPKPTVNDVLVKLAASALVRHPALNATFAGDEIQRFPAANVGIAVAAPQGLVVPVIRGPTERPFRRSHASVPISSRGRATGSSTLADLAGGTFTISNLGMFGVEQFTAVINPPQVAILAVGAVKEQAVVVDGEIGVAPMLHLMLTCDHRAIDGADGARFLQTLVALIEQPALAL